MRSVIKNTISLLVLSGIFVIATVVFGGQKAQAAPAICYGPDFKRPIPAAASSTGSALPGSASVIDCAQYANITLYTAGLNPPGVLKDDYCYVSEGWSFIERQIGQPAGAETDVSCANLATWAAARTAIPAQCYQFGEDTLDNFYANKYDPAATLKKVDCTQELIDEYLTVHAGQTTIPSGTCVVFSNPSDRTKLDSATQTCSELEDKIGEAKDAFEDDAQRTTAEQTDGAQCEAGQDCTGFGLSDSCPDAENCEFITSVVNPIIKFLAGGVGFVILIVVILGGIRYSASAGDPQKATAARKMILNALLALVTYLFLYAILAWILPGGLL